MQETAGRQLTVADYILLGRAAGDIQAPHGAHVKGAQRRQLPGNDHDERHAKRRHGQRQPQLPRERLQEGPRLCASHIC